MQVMALDVIEPWVECFVHYGEGWWVDESAQEPVPDGKILTDHEYKALAKEYEDAILSLYWYTHAINKTKNIDNTNYNQSKHQQHHLPPIKITKNNIIFYVFTWDISLIDFLVL